MRTRAFGAFMLRLIGWKFSGEQFVDAKKMVIIVAPHTSNWEFVVGVFAMYAVGIRVTFLGKDTLFKFPLGIVMRFLGGLAVDRASKSDVVTQTLMAAPMILLYVISIGIAAIFGKKRVLED